MEVDYESLYDKVVKRRDEMLDFYTKFLPHVAERDDFLCLCFNITDDEDVKFYLEEMRYFKERMLSFVRDYLYASRRLKEIIERRYLNE